MIPSPTPMTVLAGSEKTIPSDLITAHIRSARHDLTSSRRLMIVDRGGLAERHADKRIDLMIDPERGNWDICADSTREYDFAAIVATMLARAGLPPQRRLATMLLMDTIETISSFDRSGLDTLRNALCAFDQDQVSASLLKSEGAEVTTTETWSVLAILHAAGAHLKPHDRRLAPASINRWYDDPTGRIVFVQDAGDDGTVVDILGAIVELADRRASGYHAFIDFGGAVREAEITA